MDSGSSLGRKWRKRDDFGQWPTIDTFHDDIGSRCHVARLDEPRHVGALQHRQDHLLHFETVDTDARLAPAEQRRLDYDRKTRITVGGGGRTVDRASAPPVNAIIDTIAVENRPRLHAIVRHSRPDRSRHIPSSTRNAREAGRPHLRILLAAAAAS